MTMRYDHASDETIIGYHQDTTRIIEENKRAAIESDPQAQMRKDWLHYARIPCIVQLEWLHKFGVNFCKREHSRAWMKLLNSRDYSYLKRTPLRHDR